MKILLTGFTAFGNIEENPSQVIVEQMAKSKLLPEHVQLITAILPVGYDAAAERIHALIDEHVPSVVVMMGVAASRKKICLEYHAANCDTATVADNDGIIRNNRTIDARFDYYFKRSSSLPLDYLYCELRAKDIQVQRSYDAGGYVCNHTLFEALSHIADKHDNKILAGFVHVPSFDAIPQEQMLTAIERILLVMSDTSLHRAKIHPLVQEYLIDFHKVVQDNPDCSVLVSVDGFAVAHAGDNDESEVLSFFTRSIVSLGDRVSSVFWDEDFGFGIWGSKSGILLVVYLQSVPYQLVIKWSKPATLSTVYITLKSLPILVRPLMELLGQSEL